MTFDPKPHLIKVQGRQDYLEVKWRLVWLHDKHPDASIETEIVRMDDQSVVVRAQVTIPYGERLAVYTGYKSALLSGKFPAIEKAETGAIGRALAHAGFGTQFAGEDVEEGVEAGMLADAPVNRAPAPEPRPHEPAVPAGADTIALASDKQIGKIGLLCRDLGWDSDNLRSALRDRYGVESRKLLTVRQASDFIDYLQAQMPVAQPALS